MNVAIKSRKFGAKMISDIGAQNGNGLNYEDLEDFACHPNGKVARQGLGQESVDASESLQQKNSSQTIVELLNRGLLLPNS